MGHTERDRRRSSREVSRSSDCNPISIRPGDGVPPVPEIPSKHRKASVSVLRSRSTSIDLDSFPKVPDTTLNTRRDTKGDSFPYDRQDDKRGLDKRSSRLEASRGSNEWVNLPSNVTASRESLRRPSSAFVGDSWEVLPTLSQAADTQDHPESKKTSARLSVFPDTSSRVPGNPGYKPAPSLSPAGEYQPVKRTKGESSRSILSKIFNPKK